MIAEVFIVMGIWQTLSGVNPAWLALAGALFGGAGLKVVDYWLGRTAQADNTAREFRTELRADVTSLREELRKVNNDLDSWRGKYYELMDQFIKVKGQLDSSMRELRDRVDDEPP